MLFNLKAIPRAVLYVWACVEDPQFTSRNEKFFGDNNTNGILLTVNIALRNLRSPNLFSFKKIEVLSLHHFPQYQTYHFTFTFIVVLTLSRYSYISCLTLSFVDTHISF